MLDTPRAAADLPEALRPWWKLHKQDLAHQPLGEQPRGKTCQSSARPMTFHPVWSVDVAQRHRVVSTRASLPLRRFAGLARKRRHDRDGWSRAGLGVPSSGLRAQGSEVVGLLHLLLTYLPKVSVSGEDSQLI